MADLTTDQVFAAIMAAPEAPDYRVMLTEERVAGQHECSVCPEPAKAAIHVAACLLFGSPRWLDLCPACYWALRQVWMFVTEADLMAAHARWAKGREDDGQGNRTDGDAVRGL